jgi:exosortase/archaeosortase family protein
VQTTLAASAPSAASSRTMMVFSQALSREQFYAGLCALCFVNGVLLRILIAVQQEGWLSAATSTFGISVLVWAALWLGIRSLLQAAPTPIQRRDGLIAGAVIALTLIPIAALSWLAMAALACWLASRAADGSPVRRGAWILFALTVPMFWSRELFTILTDYILQIEAALIGTAMGTPYNGNMVQFADGSGYMEVWPACSSFANVSLAVLCWVMFSQVSGATAARQGALWCILACASVVAINVTRISLIGYFPQHYDLLHGPIGTNVVGWLTLAASVGICALGVRAAR